MAVEYIVTEPAGSKRMVPVTGQRVFETEWLPIAKSLGLDWVELMGTAGFDVTLENRDELLVELGRLRDWLAAKSLSASVELERIDRLVAELLTLTFNDGVSAYIG